MRQPCQWFEHGEECGKPSTSKMGSGVDIWYLCAEHGDRIVREAEMIEDDPGREDAS